MGYVNAVSRDARLVLQAQVFLTLLVAGGFGFAHGLLGALASLYGGAITILITGWLAWRVRRVGQTHSPGASLIVIYSSVVVRYTSVVVLVGTGIGVLNLPPLPLLVAFAITQFGFLAGMLSSRDVAGPGQ